MSRKELDAAVEITVAWLSAMGTDEEKQRGTPQNLDTDSVVTMFEAVYRKAKALEDETYRKPSDEPHTFG